MENVGRRMVEIAEMVVPSVTVNTMLYTNSRFQPGCQRSVLLLGGFLAYNHGTRLGTSRPTQLGMVDRHLKEG